MELWYRTESFSGSKVRNIIDIIVFEISELGNNHILEELESIVNKYNGGVESALNNIADSSMLFDDGVLLVPEKSLSNIIKLILATIGIFSGKDINYGLWLVGDRKTVREYYHGKFDDIDCYDVSDAIKLVDLGYDGALFGFETMPHPQSPLIRSDFKIIKE